MAEGSKATQRRGAAAARPEVGAPDQAPADEEGIPQQLADMRWVCARPASEDRTQGQKVCRKWLRTDISGFMARKSSMEAKLMASGGRDEEFPFRVQLDCRRLDPDCNHQEMVSVLIGVGTDRAVELYVTVEEWCGWRDAARDAGFPLWDWMRSVWNAGAIAELTAAHDHNALAKYAAAQVALTEAPDARAVSQRDAGSQAAPV
jgi:hypothetical protein